MQCVAGRYDHEDCEGSGKLYEPRKILTQAERSRKAERFHWRTALSPQCVFISAISDSLSLCVCLSLSLCLSLTLPLRTFRVIKRKEKKQIIFSLFFVVFFYYITLLLQLLLLLLIIIISVIIETELDKLEIRYPWCNGYRRR